ncbi:hypothetical protein KI387_024155, partial [Taxus chinensis]
VSEVSFPHPPPFSPPINPPPPSSSDQSTTQLEEMDDVAMEGSSLHEVSKPLGGDRDLTKAVEIEEGE